MPTGTFTVIRFYKEHCQDVETNFELAMKLNTGGCRRVKVLRFLSFEFSPLLKNLKHLLDHKC